MLGLLYVAKEVDCAGFSSLGKEKVDIQYGQSDVCQRHTKAVSNTFWGHPWISHISAIHVLCLEMVEKPCQFSEIPVISLAA